MSQIPCGRKTSLCRSLFKREVFLIQQLRKERRQTKHAMLNADHQQSVALLPVRGESLEPAHWKASDILTPEELAERLKVGVSWVYEQTRQRASRRNSDPLPCIRMGKYLRFYWPDVSDWLQGQREVRADA
jgi:hypothetical protein